QRIAEAEAMRPFDLERGPLLRARVLRLGADDHVLLLVMHHIVSDGWSTGVFMRELSALYGDEGARLPQLPVQYADFAAWQRRWLSGDVLQAQLDYWRERLAGLAPVLELPADHPRPPVKTARGRIHSFTVDAGTMAALRALGRARNATPFMTLTAAFQALLARYSGSDDIAIGTPTAGRTRAELEGLVGFFVNTLVLRTDLSGDPTFGELVERVRDVALGAYAHQDVPFEKLVEELHPQRSLSHTPLFQVMFSLENTAEAALALSDATVDRVPLDYNPSKFDLTLSMGEDDDGAGGLIAYNADLFEPATIERMAGHLQGLLKAVASDPELPLSELELLSPSERHHLVVELNGSTVAYDGARPVHELFEARVRENPDAVALVFAGRGLTYGDLDAAANRLAHHLVEKGVGPEVPVGICLERGPDLVVGLLAVLKAGAVYVPLDPDYPAERLGFMLQDTAAPVVVTTAELVERLGSPHVEAVLLDADAGVISTRPETSVAGAASPDSLAYLVYTSGSTGLPKGVGVAHRSLAGHCTAMADRYALTRDDRMLVFGSFNFDVSLEQTLTPLIAGASVVVRDDVWDPQTLANEVAALGITLLNPPTAYWHQLAADPGAVEQLLASPSLRLVAVGGEAMASSRLRAWLEAGDCPAVMNNYGPTEATITATSYEVAGALDTETVPIGRPIAGRAVYVLDRYGNLVPAGVPGELYIGGDRVARGYVNRPGLTAERFVPDPFSGERGARLYRTGDRARYLSDGNIEFLGRVDHQVKIRGFRIEPGEIEACLVAHAAVRAAVVVARSDGGDNRLVAYVVGDVATTTELRAHVSRSLPDYMVPAHFVVLDELPLTPTGKLDRAELPEPEGRPELQAPYAAPRTPAEEALAEIWCEVLGLERVGIHDDFFELGGHSLIATRVVSRMRALLGVDAPVRSLFEAPTVEALARHVEELILAEVEALPAAEVTRELTEIGGAEEREETT
ncbi:MAG TPA: amino acid adenylation domain-containing protein, partial [Actinomycetota bacterium]|nr:amino acid adenylation domain-containing protein [Actinomycetota bacterium]